SRESAFLLNNVLFLGLTFVVLFGTLLPIIVEGATGERISVGAPYFNAINAPLFGALLFLMAVGPALPWGGTSWVTARERFGGPALAAVAATMAGLLLGMRGVPQLGVLFLAVLVIGILGDELVRGARSRSRTRGEAPPLAGWRLATRNRRRYGGYLVHAGVCLMAIAVAISSTGAREASATLRVGETMQLGEYRLTLRDVVVEPLPADARVVETRATIDYGGPNSGTLATAQRSYPNSTTPIATPGVHTFAAEDLYVTLLQADPSSGTASIQVFLNPLVAWIWVGGFVVVLGAIFAVWPERRRLALATASVRAEGA
ncbi:MAG: cytochrome c-type biogenesis CcmF C-terminal domain-containing protein, partial [Chloroflexota bacterium]